LVDRVHAAAAKLVADFGINQIGRHDGRATVARQMGDASGGLLVQTVSLLQHPFNHALQRRRACGRQQPSVWVYAFIAQPLQGQIHAANACVFADIACDIGQLHRHAQLASAGQCHGLLWTHEPTHHGADAAGHAGGIAVQIFHGFVSAFVAIPSEAIQQRIE